MAIVPSKQFYVYTLIRPDGRVFYVGKGKGRRAETHLDEARHPECYCKKCRIIRIIWAMGHEVTIEYVYETDSSRDALFQEIALIRELGANGWLCNKQHNPYNPRNPPEIPIYDMTYVEYDRFLALRRNNMTKKARKEALETWAHTKLDLLRKELRKAKLYHWTADIARIETEIEVIHAHVGTAVQLRFEFVKECPTR